MSTPAPSADDRKVIVVDGPSPELQMLHWPLRDEPIATAASLCVALAISAGIGLMAASIVWGIVAAVALMLSLWRMWVPVEFRFCRLGVIQTALRRSWRIPWTSLAGYEVRQAGILLLPDDDNSILGRLKGLYIPWGEQKDELLALIDHYFQHDS